MPSSSSRGEEDQPRRRRKEYDRERESTTAGSKDKHRTPHKSSTPSKQHRRRSTSRERTRSNTSLDKGTRKVSIAVPEMERRPSGEVRSKASYPTFSKAHSREAVHSKEDISNTKRSPYTPDATEVGQEKYRRRNSNPVPAQTPPSPPLTAENPAYDRSASGGSMRNVAEQMRSEMVNGRRSADVPSRGTPPPKASKPKSSPRKEARFPQSDISSMPGAFPEDEQRSTSTSGYRRTVSTASQPASDLTQGSQESNGAGTDSDATSIAPERKPAQRQQDSTPPREKPPTSFTDSQPKTSNAHEASFPYRTKTPNIDVAGANAYTPGSDPKTPMTAMPPPPPPPPPPVNTGSQPPPRVDYLLRNGGLSTLIPRRLVQHSPAVQQYAMYQSPALGAMAPAEEYSKIFQPLHKRLDDYLHVLRHSGSLAVATGYKSVARRLLDKLSQVFARDISSQRCDCVICKTSAQPALSDEEDSGYSWGELLEIVSGRRDLPQWPPFTIAPDDCGLGIAGSTQAPMQKLDIDVPDEYKDHYIRQNQKTKKAVQSWLAQQPEYASSPPEEADEDTLMFAMMTKLDAQQRSLFIALMHGQNFLSASRAPTPAERPSTASDALKRARKALQRLYRLDRPPRDCECAMYLLNNPHLHGMLATLAEVNEGEWDILVSGRFDGFLWSGAEQPFPPSASAYNSPAASRGPSRGANGTPVSRNTTPFSGMSGFQPSRGPTPFSPLRNVVSPDGQAQAQPPSMFPARGSTPAGDGVSAPAPVQMDEDTEIAVLAEVERNLFTDMERFEDAFEILHSRAELVRQLLRERGAGLAMQRRNGDVGVRLDTPASGVTDFEDEADDDGLADLASLAPDDSASQISVSRRQRKRHERRTPAPVAEEDESVFEEQVRGGGGAPTPVSRANQGGRRSKY